MIEFKVHKLWAWMPMYGITLGKHIFLKNVQDKMALEHELVHVDQQKAHPVWFWVSYLLLLPIFWNPWRKDWEAQAYAVQVKAGCSVESIAQMLSGPMYLWCCPQKDAEAAIKKWL